MKIVFIISSVVVIIAICCSCKDHEISSKKCYIKNVAHSYSSGGVYSQMKVEKGNHQLVVTKFLLQSVPTDTIIYTSNFDNSERLINTKVTGTRYYHEKLIEYDQRGKPNKEILLYDATQVRNETSIYYLENGNVIKGDTIFYLNGNRIKDGSKKYFYNAKENKTSYFGLDSYFLPCPDGYILPSNRNLLDRYIIRGSYVQKGITFYTQSELFYSYEFNSDGYPVKIIAYLDQAGTYIYESFELEYECL